jgi:hypothetical protein
MPLQQALHLLATAHVFAAELATAARLVHEDRLIAEGTLGRRDGCRGDAGGADPP